MASESTEKILGRIDERTRIMADDLKNLRERTERRDCAIQSLQQWGAGTIALASGFVVLIGWLISSGVLKR
jgi:hypothetical protein